MTFDIFWRMLRPHTLTASFIPVFLGTSLALFYQEINFFLFSLMLFACLLIQSATNMFNEYFDFKRGLDNEDSVGIGGTIVRDGLRPEQVLYSAFACLFIAGILGLILSYKTHWILLPIGALGILVGYLYTGGPLPIAYTPFGEIISGAFMGFGIIAISFFIQAGFIDKFVVLISLPNSILIGAILLSNNIRDLDRDKLKGRKTLAILLGKKRAVYLLGAMFITSYLLLIIYFLKGIFPIWIFLSFFSIPLAYEAFTEFQEKDTPKEMMSAMQKTAQTNTLFGLLLSFSLLFQKFFI